jgi:Holliday junction resolvase RusA-like endonuclease
MKIEFIIPGVPRGKGRPKFFRRGSFMGTYTPKETASYENLVKLVFMEAANKSGWKKVDAPIALQLEIYSYFQIPQSWSAKKKVAANLVTKKPDGDNIWKIIADSLNGLAYDDDSQIAVGLVHKKYTAQAPQTEVTISTIFDGEPNA